jgi:hypothetical protein
MAPPVAAQAQAAPTAAAPASDLETIVGPIALYPDDLVAIILPASTNPLQIVQAERFLEKRKADPKAPIDDKWDDAVKSLVNYPEVIKKMSTDLDWTTALGEAVVADQGAVLSAIQAFRRKAQSAGNLKSDDKQVVVVEKEVITIAPADPQVVYVPQYNPSTVVVYSSVPAYGYYPAPYPSYYYPYAPGAALATGLIWGAAIGAAWGGGRYQANYSGGNNNITVNRGDVNVGSGNTNRSGNRTGQSTAWKSDKKPGQVSSGAGRASPSNNARVGDPGRGAGGAGSAGGAGDRSAGGAGDRSAGGAGDRSAGGAGDRSGAGGGRSSSPSVSNTSARTGGGDAFSGYGSGNSARADSSRGASSRASSSASTRSSAGASAGASRGGGGGGGGGRGGGGGGGGRGGGGGGGGRR